MDQICGADDFQRQFDVSRETLERLDSYAALLKRWQKTINLVAPKTLDVVWHRHFADSAQLMRLIPVEARRLVDLGSGAGFPGLVLAIMAAGQPERALKVTLIESDTRKAAFLRDVVRHLGLAVDIMSTRIESIPKSANVGADVITSRALAPLPRLLALAEPFFRPHSVGLFLKGRSVDTEVGEARQDWVFGLDLLDSMTESEARIAVIKDLRRKKEG